MDLIKIGNFIKLCRKRKNMTQHELGEKIGVEANTISKWETGKGFPDVAIIETLCKQLDISISELFFGEFINGSDSKMKFEDEILKYYKNETIKNRRNLIGEILVGISFILSIVTIFLLVGLNLIESYIKIVTIILAIIYCVIGLVGLIVLDVNIGYFECGECRERFVPSIKDYIFGIHTLRKRKLRCPKCKKKTWCSKRISKE